MKLSFPLHCVPFACVSYWSLLAGRFLTHSEIFIVFFFLRELPLRELPETLRGLPLGKLPKSRRELPLRELPKSRRELPLRELPKSHRELPLRELPRPDTWRSE